MNKQDNYEKFIDYIEHELLTGQLKIGDRLPPERKLSEELQISRGAVRFGLAVLHAIGVIASKQGSGNYINGAFDHKLTQIMTMMFALEDMDQREILGFRYAAEQEALILTVHTATDTQKTMLNHHLSLLLSAEDPAVQSYHDKMLHQIIVEASGNRLVIAQYMALNKFLDTVIRDVRDKTGDRGLEYFEQLEDAHRTLIEGICDGRYEKAKMALDEHYDVLMNTINLTPLSSIFALQSRAVKKPDHKQSQK